jgi:ParB family chromosome partitioning protein
MVDEQRPRLGRGLAALIGDSGPESAIVERGTRRVPIEFIRPNPRNPRRTFTDEGLDELASSIREKGLIQPIVVRPVDGSPRNFEIIAGERRWRASQRAGLHDVPVIVINASERESLELAIVENVQRADLNSVEEARGYEQLMSEFAYTQADLSKVIGKSRSHVANTLRLLKLPGSVLSMVETGDLTAGHARALLSFNNPEQIARTVVDQHLNVRDVEELARSNHANHLTPLERKSQTAAMLADPNIRDLEKSLSDALGLKVNIQHRGDGGELRIRYASIDQLDGLCERLR